MNVSGPHGDDYARDRVADEEIRVARAEELEALVHTKSKIHRRIALWQLAAYLLIIFISVIGWIRIENEADARCRSGEENRQAIRDVVSAIYQLGASAVPEERKDEPEAKAYLERLENFQKEQHKLLEGPVCPEGG